MLPRITLVVVTLFWLAMNLLLWRAEYGSRPGALTPLPVDVVWQKVLTAPDSSSLTVFHRGKRIGFCHWTPTVNQLPSKAAEQEGEPEGMMSSIANFRIQLDGNLNVGEFAKNLRFDSDLQLNARRVWREFNLRLNFPSATVEVHSLAAEQLLHLKADNGQDQFERTFRFEDLRRPERLLREVSGPVGQELWDSIGLPRQQDQHGPLEVGLQWQARHDRLKIAHSLARVYRLEAHVVERYEVVLFVSRVGEILRVELPDDLILVNDQLTGF